MRKRQGYSLIELATVLSVVAISVGMVLTGFNTMHHRLSIQTATHRLFTSLNAARLAAISRQRRTIVCPSRDARRCADSVDWSQGWLVFLDGDKNLEFNQGPDTLLIVDGPAKSISATSTAQRRRAIYRADGRSDGNNMTFTLCGTDSTEVEGRQIIINNAGRARTARHLCKSSP